MTAGETGEDRRETRRFPRFAVKVPVYISILDGTVFRKMLPLESKDISEGGMAFETSQMVPLDAESRVLVSKLGDLDPAARIHGRVVHREQNPVTGRYSVGMEFTEFVGVTREELLRHIDAWKV